MLMTATPFPDLVTYIGMSLTLFTVLSVASLLVFRRRQPGWQRLRAMDFAYPLIPALYILVGTAMVIFGMKEHPMCIALRVRHGRRWCAGLSIRGASCSLVPERPTHVRYWVIVFAVTLSIITYIDRVAISVVTPFIQNDLAISDKQMGLCLGAFALAYSLFEMPGGFMGDRLGPRRVLLRIVVWWSCFTAATGFVWNRFP